MRLRYRYLFIQVLFIQIILSSAIIELPDLVRESNKSFRFHLSVMICSLKNW